MKRWAVLVIAFVLTFSLSGFPSSAFALSKTPSFETIIERFYDENDVFYNSFFNGVQFNIFDDEPAPYECTWLIYELHDDLLMFRGQTSDGEWKVVCWENFGFQNAFITAYALAYQYYLYEDDLVIYFCDNTKEDFAIFVSSQEQADEFQLLFKDMFDIPD